MLTGQVLVCTVGELHCRSLYGLVSSTIGSFYLGDTMTVRSTNEVSQDDYTWVPVTGKNMVGWIAYKVNKTGQVYVRNAPSVPVPPPVPTQPLPKPPINPSVSKISLHIMPGANKLQTLGLFSSMDKAHKPIPGCTLVKFGWDSEIQVTEIHQASPSTRVLLRHYNQDWDHRGVDWENATYQDGYRWCQDYYNTFVAPNADSQRAEWHQIINEPSFGPGTRGKGKATMQWWTGALDFADSKKIKLAVFAFPAGYPEPDWFLDYLPLLMRIKSGGHILMLHQYTLGQPWTNDYTIMRHKRILNLLPTTLKDILICFAEFGDEKMATYGDARFVAGIAAADNAMRGDPVLYGGLWTNGGGGAWQGDLVDSRIPALQAYLLNFK